MPRRPSRATWVYATVTVVAGACAFTLNSWWPERHEPLWRSLLMTACIGVFLGFGLSEFMRVLRMRAIWRAARHLPREIQLERQDDGSFVVFATRLDGDPRVVRLPEDYDPHEDEGRQMFDLLTKPD